MEPTELTSSESDDLDAPAYCRAPTSLSEIERRQSQRTSDRDDAGNRTFNRQFWFTLASEVGGVPTGMTTSRVFCRPRIPATDSAPRARPENGPVAGPS